MSDQFIRKASLVVAAGAQGIELSEMQIQFSIGQSDLQTPNTAYIRVINLSEQTARRVQKEFTRVILQAGYEGGNFGIIFDGTIKEVRRGRMNATDTFLDIFASDSDIPYNFALVNGSLAAGSTAHDRLNLMVAAFAKASPGVNVGYAPDVPLGPALPRGKVLFGMSKDYMRDWAATAGTSWSIQNGQVTIIPLTGYLPGQAVVISADTGMIGMPEQTDGGIRVRCLLNPLLKIGGRVQIDNKSIIPGRINLAYGAVNNLASISNDGFYKIYCVDLSGDTRGNDWYADLTCFSIDQSAPAADAVNPYGG